MLRKNIKVVYYLMLSTFTITNNRPTVKVLVLYIAINVLFISVLI